MLTYLIYSNTDKDGKDRMETLANNLKPARVDCELVDADSKDGVTLVQSYDILARPAVLLTREDGSVLQLWTDRDHLPAAEEISYLAHL